MNEKIIAILIFALIHVSICDTQNCQKNTLRFHNQYYNITALRELNGFIPSQVLITGNDLYFSTGEHTYKFDEKSNSPMMVSLQIPRYEIFHFVNNTRVTMVDGKTFIMNERNISLMIDNNENYYTFAFAVDPLHSMVFTLSKNVNKNYPGMLNAIKIDCNNIARNQFQVTPIGKLGNQITSLYIDQSTGDIILGTRHKGKGVFMRLIYQDEDPCKEPLTRFEAAIESAKTSLFQNALRMMPIRLEMCSARCTQSKNKCSDYQSKCTELQSFNRNFRAEFQKLLKAHSDEIKNQCDRGNIGNNEEKNPTENRINILGQQMNLIQDELENIPLIKKAAVFTTKMRVNSVPAEQQHMYECASITEFQDIQKNSEDSSRDLRAVLRNVIVMKSELASAGSSSD